MADRNGERPEGRENREEPCRHRHRRGHCPGHGERVTRSGVAHHECEVSGQQREPARVQCGDKTRSESQPQQFLAHPARAYPVSAETRLPKSCSDIADVGLFTKLVTSSALTKR